MTTLVLLVSLSIAGAGAASPPLTNAELRCGAYCTYVGLKSLDFPVGEFKPFESRLGQPSPMGYSMQQLADAATSYKAHVLGVETSVEHLARRGGRFACVALLEKSGHFVCIYDVDASSVYLIDPPVQRVASRDAFSKLWSGKALLISDQPLTLSRDRRIPVWAYIAAFAGAASVTIIFLLTRFRRVEASR